MSGSEYVDHTKTKSGCWSITINNPTNTDLQQWETLKTTPWVKSVEGQLEKGESGTLHIQGMLKTDYVRHSQVRRALPRARIEKARNETALATYVHKQETRVGDIPRPTVRVATQADVQDSILMLLMGGAQFRYEGWNPLPEKMPENLHKFSYELGKEWEFWTDKAVQTLIHDGYYGVEFVMANPQIRTAFRKYFVAIVYRQYMVSYGEYGVDNRQVSEPETIISPEIID